MEWTRTTPLSILSKIHSGLYANGVIGSRFALLILISKVKSDQSLQPTSHMKESATKTTIIHVEEQLQTGLCHFCYSIPARCLSVLEGIRCSSHLILIKYRGDVKSLSVGHPRTLLGGVVHDVLHPSRCFHKLANDTFVSQVPRVVIDALFEFFPFRLLPSINNSLQFLLHVPEVFRFSHSFLWVPKLEISPPRFTNRQIFS